MEYFAKLFHAIKAIYVIQRNFEMCGVGVTMMDINVL